MANCYASKVVDVALSQVGYLEKESNKNLYSKTGNAGDENYTKYAYEFDTKYPNFYNGKKNGYAWCDIFVDWCLVEAFGVNNALKLLGQPLKSCGAGCSWSVKYYEKIGRLYDTPKVGDQIFFKDSSGEPCHTGIVYKVTSTTVYTIEGNTSSEKGVVANGGAVAKKSYSRAYNRIHSYGRPKYDAEPKNMAKKKTIKDVAKDVLDGKYGDGETRKQKLKAEGYDPVKVQAEVNKLIEQSKPKVTYRIYTVRKNDTLWEIAIRQLGNGSRYREIKSLNKLKSDTIHQGQKLKLPKK